MEIMKTQTVSKKMISRLVIICVFLSENIIAQKQNEAMESNEPKGNMTLMLCILSFIIGFAVINELIIKHDDKKYKYKKQN